MLNQIQIKKTWQQFCVEALPSPGLCWGKSLSTFLKFCSGLTDQDHRVAVEKIIFFFFWVYQIDSTVSPVSPESQPWNECTQLKTTESKATHHKPMQCIQMYFASSTIFTCVYMSVPLSGAWVGMSWKYPISAGAKKIYTFEVFWRGPTDQEQSSLWQNN